MINGFKIGFLINNAYLNNGMEEICASLKGLGYDAIELPAERLFPNGFDTGNAKKVLEAISSSGLELSELVVQRELVTRDEDERKSNIKNILDCFTAMGDLGIKTANLFTGPRPWIDNPLTIGKNISMGEAWDMVFNAFDKIVPAAEKNSVDIALESVFAMAAHDFYTASFLIDHYKSKNFGVNFDPSHDILSGNNDSAWIIKQYGKEKIKHIHLKDAAGIYQGNRFVFPLLGEGKVDWKAFRQALIDIGYKGAMSVEFESFAYLANVLDGNLEEAARISIRDIRKLFA